MAEEGGEEQGILQQLELAVTSRLQHFKDQADSLTLESVRRLLEKDLGLEKFALDEHKRFIKQYLEKKMEDADDCDSNTVTENEVKDVDLIKEEEARVLPKQHDTKNDSKKPSSGDEEMTEDSPIMGVLTPKSEADTQGSSVSESRIEKAFSERADHFLANIDTMTLAGVRRLLEEDLGLDKYALDPFKKFISQKIDQVVNPPEEAKSVKHIKKNTSAQIKKSEKTSSEEESDASGNESEMMEDKVKSRKKTAPKRQIKKLEEPKKRKISKEIDIGVSSKKQKKLVKRKEVEDNDPDENGSASEDDQSQSPVEKRAEMKEQPASVYGKKVENLKSVIKACGMSVPPVIYKKAKQVPENKREAFVVKELEEILSREGLSKNPSEKEIKDCKKRKETARELEGIDMSNIISSSRRRSTFSFMTPPTPAIRAKADKVVAKDIKNKKKNDKDQNDDDDDDEDEEKKVKEKKKEEKAEENKSKNEDEKKDEDEVEEEEEENEEGEEEEEDDDEEEEEEDESEEEFNEEDDEDSD